MQFIYFTDKENAKSITANGITPRNSICGYDKAIYFVPNIDLSLSDKEELDNVASWNLICQMEEDRDIENSIAINFELFDSDFPLFLKSDLRKLTAINLAEKMESTDEHSIEYAAKKKFSSVLKGINNHDFVNEAKFKMNSIADLKLFIMMYESAGGQPHAANSFFLWTTRTIEKSKVTEYRELTTSSAQSKAN